MRAANLALWASALVWASGQQRPANAYQLLGWADDAVDDPAAEALQDAMFEAHCEAIRASKQRERGH